MSDERKPVPAEPEPEGSALDKEVKAIKPVVPIKGQLELFTPGDVA